MYNLATKRFLQYSRTGNKSDPDEAIAYGARSVESVPDNHRPHLPKRQNELGNFVYERYRLLGNERDFRMAIKFCQEAFAFVVLDKHNPDAITITQSYADKLAHQYEKTKNRDDLEFAITIAKSALALAPMGNVRRGCQNSVGALAAAPFCGETHLEKDLEYACTVLLEAWNTPNAFPLDYARTAAQLLPL